MGKTVKQLNESADQAVITSITETVKHLREAYESLKVVECPAGTRQAMAIDGFRGNLNYLISDLERFINEGGAKDGEENLNRSSSY